MSAPGLIYLDHHATTPADPRVVAAMLPWFAERAGNPGSLHRRGADALEAVAAARAQVAALLGCEPGEIVFTSGATEADNLALLGVARAAKARGGSGRVIVSAVEHRAVLDAARQLEREGHPLAVLPVDRQGAVDPDELKRELKAGAAVCSVMTVNNESGAIQPVAELAVACRAAGVPFHTDAAQAIGRVPFSLRETPAALATLSGHKFHGPPGIGALAIRRTVPPLRVTPLMFGGGQERALRPGTHNVPAIVGLGVACEILAREGEAERRRLAELRDRLWDALRGSLDGLTRVGPPPARRHPGHLAVAIEGAPAAALLLALKDRVACSSGAACSAGTNEPSHVLAAMKLPPAVAHTVLRFGVGRFTTAAEIDAAARIVAGCVRELRAASSPAPRRAAPRSRR